MPFICQCKYDVKCLWFNPVSVADIKEHVKQIEKAVLGKEPRFVLRALRALPSTSRRLNTNVLHKTISGFYTNSSSARDYLLGFLDEVRPRPLAPGFEQALEGPGQGLAGFRKVTIGFRHV